MFNNFHFYLLDNVSETIIGQFFAKSERMAKKMLDAFDFGKANLSKADCSVVCDNRAVPQLETYDDVRRSEFCVDCSDLLGIAGVLDFESDEDDA